jgi:predicted transcriptional regulator
MAVMLSEETEFRLHQEARRRGYDVDRLVEMLLDTAEALQADVELTEEDRVAIREGIARGLADSEAGRVRSEEQVFARLKEKYGV